MLISSYQKFSIRQINNENCEVRSFMGLYILHMNIMHQKQIWHIDKCVDEWSMKLWMNGCLPINPCVDCVFNAWYHNVKHTNYEWTNITWFHL